VTHLWEIQLTGVTEVQSTTINIGAMFTAAQISNDLSQIATSDNNMSLKLWEADTGEMIQDFPMGISSVPDGHNQYINDLKLSPDGKKIVTAGKDGKAIVWELGTGKPLTILSGHNGIINSVEFNPDGSLIATACSDQTLRIWNASTGEVMQILKGHKSPVLDAVFSPDGKSLLSGGGDNYARLWDVQTGTLLQTFGGHTGWVDSLAFSSDGRRLAAGSGGERGDGTIILYEAAFQQPPLVIPGHEVIFAPSPEEGAILAIISDDLTMRGYSLDLQHTIDLACKRLKRSFSPEECQQYHVEPCQNPCAAE
jgi:WD40 repeat protein